MFDIGETLEDMIAHYTEFEASLVSVERAVFFTNLKPEIGYKGIAKEERIIGIGGPKDMLRLAKFEKLRIEFEKERRVGLKKGIKSEREVGRRKDKKLKNFEKFESVVTHGEVVFENVSARYSSTNKCVLKKLNVKISPGEKIGIIGRTGSGKSSLIKLIWRYFEPSSGTIFVDGKNISKVNLKALRSQMTIITQETSLFEGTLRENLDPTKFRFSDKELSEALQELRFSHKSYQEEGLDMLIDTEGNNLSQGERQLVCFARSILRPTRLVLLDEATTNIDLKTEETIQASIKKCFTKSTMLIVAHRVQTVLECDRIIVLHSGEIVEFDSPMRLMKKDGFFNDIVKKMGE